MPIGISDGGVVLFIYFFYYLATQCMGISPHQQLINSTIYTSECPPVQINLDTTWRTAIDSTEGSDPQVTPTSDTNHKSQIVLLTSGYLQVYDPLLWTD